MHVSTPGIASYSPWWHTHPFHPLASPAFCAIGGPGRVTSAAVQLSVVDGSTDQFHCYSKQNRNSRGVRISMISFPLLCIWSLQHLLYSVVCWHHLWLYPLTLWKFLPKFCGLDYWWQLCRCLRSHSGEFHMGQRSESGSHEPDMDHQYILFVLRNLC